VKTELVRAAVLAMTMAGASTLAVVVTPRTYMAEQQVRAKLSEIVPLSFGDWAIDRTVIPVPPSPDLQQVLDATYDETLARTYRNGAGQRVMLSLAYGRNQHKGMNTHRPEVCYPAQGFQVVQDSVPVQLHFGERVFTATRTVAELGPRHEPITYWLMVGERITSFGYAQRAVSIGYGLRGILPDGVLVRVSSIDRDRAAAFALQERFIADLLAAVEPAELPRLLGSVVQERPAP
jgi:EpsI family protein